MDHEGKAVREQVERLVEEIRKTLTEYRYPNCHNEQRFQSAVAEVLVMRGFRAPREVIAERGRYDIEIERDGVRVVLELKIKGSAADAERQCQRYAMTPDVHAVMLVTTSHRLAAEVAAGSHDRSLPGDGGTRKPFELVLVRSAL